MYVVSCSFSVDRNPRVCSSYTLISRISYCSKCRKCKFRLKIIGKSARRYIVSWYLIYADIAPRIVINVVNADVYKIIWMRTSLAVVLCRYSGTGVCIPADFPPGSIVKYINSIISSSVNALLL